MIVGAILLTVAIAAWLYFLWSRRRFYLCALKMKGPWGFPLIGIVHKVYKVEEILNVLPNIAKEYKTKTYFSWLGPNPMVYTMDPEVAQIVLQSNECLNKASVYDVLDYTIGSGLLTSRTPKWLKHRKLLNPCFGYKVLLGKFPEFNSFARQLCRQIDSLAGHGEVDVKDLTLKMGLKAAIAIAMGTDIDEESNADTLNAFESALGFGINRILQPWYHNNALYKWSKDYKPFKVAQAGIMDFTQGLVKAKIEVLEDNNNIADKKQEEVSHVFIDQAIRIHQQKEFTIEEVVDESNIIVIAAYETTANILYTTLMFLAMNPHIQERVFDEISMVFQDNDFDVTYDDFKSLVYLDMCINETLRLTPSIPLIGRECSKDLRISKDIVVPAGGEVFIDIFNIHRDEDIWGPNAKTYNPDNFLPSNLQTKHKYAFLPFSKGKRNCVGWQYAGMFLKVMLAQIIRKYRFTTTFRYEDMKYVEYITLKYVETPRLAVHRR